MLSWFEKKKINNSLVDELSSHLHKEDYHTD